MVKQRGWNQDTIAREIITYLRLTLSDPSVNFSSVCYPIRSEKDMDAMVDANPNVEWVGDLKLIMDVFVNDAVQLKAAVPFQHFFIEDNVYHVSNFLSAYNDTVDTLNVHVANHDPINHFNQRAHRDILQIIPPYRYTAGGLENVVITSNVMASEGEAQLIFSSDGWYKNITVMDNVLSTQGKHPLTLAGVISGTFKDNRDFSGNLILPSLYPLRLGGGRLNYHIMSMTGDDDYQDIEGVTGTFYDKRRVPRRGLNIYGFPLQEFIRRYKCLDESLDRFDRTEQVINELITHKIITVKKV